YKGASSMALSATVKRLSLIGALFFGLCTVVASLLSLGIYISGVGVDQPVPLGPLLRQEFKEWYACGALSLGVLWFCGRNRLESGRLKQWALAHFAGACAFSAIYSIRSCWLVAGVQLIRVWVEIFRA